MLSWYLFLGEHEESVYAGPEVNHSLTSHGVVYALTENTVWVRKSDQNSPVALLQVPSSSSAQLVEVNERVYVKSDLTYTPDRDILFESATLLLTHIHDAYAYAYSHGWLKCRLGTTEKVPTQGPILDATAHTHVQNNILVVSLKGARRFFTISELGIQETRDMTHLKRESVPSLNVFVLHEEVLVKVKGGFWFGHVLDLKKEMEPRLELQVDVSCVRKIGKTVYMGTRNGELVILNGNDIQRMFVFPIGIESFVVVGELLLMRSKEHLAYWIHNQSERAVIVPCQAFQRVLQDNGDLICVGKKMTRWRLPHMQWKGECTVTESMVEVEWSTETSTSYVRSVCHRVLQFDLTELTKRKDAGKVLEMLKAGDFTRLVSNGPFLCVDAASDSPSQRQEHRVVHGTEHQTGNESMNPLPVQSTTQIKGQSGQRSLIPASKVADQIACRVVCGKEADLDTDTLLPYLLNTSPLIQDTIRDMLLTRPRHLKADTSLPVCLYNMLLAQHDTEIPQNHPDVIIDSIKHITQNLNIAPHLIRTLIPAFQTIKELNLTEDVLGSLFLLLNQPRKIETLATQTLLDITRSHPRDVMTAILHLLAHDSSVPLIQAILKGLIQLTRRCPTHIHTSLSDILIQLLQKLDPAQAIRADIIDYATVYLAETVKVFPSIAYDAVLSRLAIASLDGHLTVYDLQSTAPIFEQEKAHSQFITCCAFSPDGKRLVSVSLTEDMLRVWRMPGVSLTAQAWTNWTKDKLVREVQLHIIDSASEQNIKFEWAEKHLTCIIGHSRIGLSV